jgi:D-3-phosphoglycerate dehydrogenase / 2-oxoglutarate reductase
MMRVLGVVTARGGSQRVPRKNLAPLLGKPLLAYTAEAALKAHRLTRVILSTDDDEIARTGAQCGLDVPFMRPSELAEDTTPSVSVLQHALREIEREDAPYDAVFALQPTNPLRTAEDIDGAIELLERSGADSVNSYTDVGEKHPARMKYVQEDGTVVDPPFAEQFEGQAGRTLPRLYLREGSVYVTRRSVLVDQNSLKGNRCLAWIIPEERARNIDTAFDLLVAQQLLKCEAERRARDLDIERARLSHLPGNLSVLIAESKAFSHRAAETIRATGHVLFMQATRNQLLRSLRDIDVLWVRLGHRIDAEVMNAAPRLRYILSATTGLNHIDLVEAERRGIEVISLRGETDFLRDVHATAEHTVALILAMLRKLPAATLSAVLGAWERERFRGEELYGKTVGIVGYGRLGRMVAPLLHAFGARVVANDRKSTLPAAVPLDQLLWEADIVSLHVSFDESLRGFFGRKQFTRMRPHSWFVNTSRGELVDEDALIEALRSGHLAGAALDVVSGENNADLSTHPLVLYAREHPNLILTPHIGGCTTESLEKAELFLAEKFVRIHTEHRFESANA